MGSFLVGLVVSIVFLFLTVGNSLYRAITKYTPFDTTLLSLLWSSPYWDYPIFESMCKTGTGLITDVKKLEGKTLIVTKEITAETYFEKNHPEVKLQKYDQYSDAYQALLDGRGDAFSTDNTEVLAWILENKGFEEFSYVKRSLRAVDFIQTLLNRCRLFSPVLYMMCNTTKYKNTSYNLYEMFSFFPYSLNFIQFFKIGG